MQTHFQILMNINLASHYPYGILPSFAFSADRVLPVFKKHLGMQEHSMLFQFSRLCTKNPEVTLAVVGAAVVTAAYRAGYFYLDEIRPRALL
jgi:hypothetical protein